MLIDGLILGIMGVSFGLAVAGGFFALIIALGLLSRFAFKTHTASHIFLYEDAVALGGIFGTSWLLYEWRIPAGYAGLGLYGFMAGIFVGAWAMALTEIIDTIPVFMRRTRITIGLKYFIWAMALGRSVGVIFAGWVK